MICGIVINEGDLDQYVEIQTNAYIVLKLCVVVEEKPRLFDVWDVC